MEKGEGERKSDIDPRPTCESCGRRDLRFRKNGHYFCKQCGFDSSKGM